MTTRRSEPYEVEMKFPAVDPDAVRRRLESLGASGWREQRQIDQYFAHPARDFAATDEALRVRCENGRALIAYKGPKIDAATKTRREIEIELAGGRETAGQAMSLLQALGFRPVGSVRKRRLAARVPWQGDPVTAALDDVEGLGGFVELELAADQQGLDAARERLLSLASALGLGPGERRSYLELLLEAGGPGRARRRPE